MSTFGNGFLAYHVEVQVRPEYVQTAHEAVNEWNDEFRADAGWPGFPASLLTRIKAVPGVLDVICQGLQTAVLIPLRMPAA